ncbi:MAG: histidinol dehydrogenase [Candidatus Lindowbacteria bacterium RIFCSPLOWO2_02_FULL_62_12]|nr:MAG: histidinol dehydrogenase [Candidatus Lindowbacteria bacterium RIFCSPLOWO2_02_FULL_62_12]
MNVTLGAFFRRREEFRRRARLAERAVRIILSRVRKEGDAAVLRYTERWDIASLKTLRVTDDEFESARASISTQERLILETVIDRLQKFYESQKMRAAPRVDATGLYAERVAPIERVGLYVPGGKAPLLSTLLMLAVPAKVAGVPERYVATPPRPDGRIPAILAEAARLTGVTAVFKMGGAQSMAAFAYGTRSVPQVDKIFGPGNVYVTAAKRLLYGDVGIDMLAGPSELAVIADNSVSADFVTEDLLAQAEHGPDSLSLLLTTSPKLGGQVKKRIDKSDEEIRRQIYIVIMKSLESCAAVAAELAPEHLALCVSEPEKLLSAVGPAGAIFLGTSCVAYGDYIAGPNHTLPTAGTARLFSPLSIESFCRRSSILQVRDPDGELARLGSILAEWEGLPHHSRSLRLRAEK